VRQESRNGPNIIPALTSTVTRSEFLAENNLTEGGEASVTEVPVVSVRNELRNTVETTC